MSVSQAQVPPRTRLWIVLAGLALIALVAAGYANSLSNGFVWDDHQQIVLNPNVKADAPIAHVFTQDVRFVRHREMIEGTDYRPLQMLTYRLLFGAYGTDPMSFHVCSVVFAAGCVLAAFAVFLCLTQRLPLAFAGAVLFATYPIHTEAVDWIAALPELGCTLFLLLSFSLYLTSARASGAKRWLGLGLSGVAYALALLWKETALVFPLLVVVYVLLNARGGSKRLLSLLLQSLPYWSVLAGYLALRYAVLGEFAAGHRDWALSPVQLGLNALWLMESYWAKLALPFGLNAYYNFVPIRSLAEPRGAVTVGVFAAVVAAVVILWRRWLRTDGSIEGELSETDENPASPRLGIFLMCWVGITLLPAMNIAALGRNPFTERYLYLPSVGLCLLLALAGAWLVGRMPLKFGYGAGVILLVVVTGGFMAETITRNPVWKDDATLFGQTLLRSPDAPFVRMMVASTQSTDPSLSSLAAENYRKSIELAMALTPPDRIDAARSYQGLALIDADHSNFQQAMQVLADAEELDPEDPNISGEQGLVLTRAGDGKDAVPLLQKALVQEPDNVNVLSALGVAERDALHNPAEAERLFERVIAVDTEEDGLAASAHNNLGAAFGEEGQFDRAAEEFRIAARIRPGNVDYRVNLAISLANAGHLAEAREAATAAIQLDPNDETPRELLEDLASRGHR